MDIVILTLFNLFCTVVCVVDSSVRKSGLGKSVVTLINSGYINACYWNFLSDALPYQKY